MTDDASVVEEGDDEDGKNGDDESRPMWKVGRRTRTVMEEWVPQTEHGRVVYVKRTDTQMQLK